MTDGATLAALRATLVELYQRVDALDEATFTSHDAIDFATSAPKLRTLVNNAICLVDGCLDPAAATVYINPDA